MKTFVHAKEIARHPVARNIVALSSIQGARYLLPLLTIPYLARVLRPEGWGEVAFAQALTIWAGLVVNYGFGFSATRNVARCRSDRDQIARLVAGVQGAKILLSFGILALVVTLLQYSSAFHRTPALLWWATCDAVLQGLSPIWYFQGHESLRTPAMIDISGRVIFTCGVFLFVHRPDQTVLVLQLQAFGSLIVCLSNTWRMYRESRLLWPRLQGALSALQDGFSMFLFQLATSVYTVMNGFLLGLFVPPILVGYYVGAQRISAPAVSMLGPVSQSFFPHINHRLGQSKAEGAKVARKGVLLLSMTGLALSAIIFVSAPLAVRIVLGPAYATVVPILRILSALPLLISVSNAFGVQWMLSLRMDRQFNAIVIGAGVINVVLAVLLAPRFGAVGMAGVVVFTELLVTLLTVGTLYYKKLSPFQIAGAGPMKPGDAI